MFWHQWPIRIGTSLLHFPLLKFNTHFLGEKSVQSNIYTLFFMSDTFIICEASGFALKQCVYVSEKNDVLSQRMLL